MLVGIFTSNYKEEFDIEVSNLYQLKDYLVNNKKYLWDEIKDKQLCYAIFDDTNTLKEQILFPSMLGTDITAYSTLVITEKVDGEFIATIAFLATYAVWASIAIFGTALFSGAAAMWVIGLALVIGFGMLMQMLVPTPNMGNNDPSKKKDLMFNGIPNISEQGGSIPLIFGECLFGGVLIGNTLSTVDFKVGSSFTPDANVPLVASVSATTIKVTNTNVVESEWYRVG